MKKKLNLQALINFFDVVDEASRKQASAINAVLGEDLGVELLVRYLVSTKKYQSVVALDQPVGTGKQKGPRLDKWVVCKKKPNQGIIYQVEIKNWSGHSVGGRRISANADEKYLRSHRRIRWLDLFDANKLHLKHSNAKKVLVKMRPPAGYETFVQQPLICFWDAIHPRGKEDAFFYQTVRCTYFKKLAVFSMSNYVRILMKHSTTKKIDFQMNEVDKRLASLKKIYS